MITTDYSRNAVNTLCGAPLTRYRFSHWLCDIIKNMMSDPLNIADERLSRLLFVQDGKGVDECRALFQVALPYSKDSRKAGTTPAILVSAADVVYEINPVINRYGSSTFSNTAGQHIHFRKINGKIAVVTESLDGTLLLMDIIENFILVNQQALAADGMVGKITMLSSSEPQEIKIGDGANAKPLYQAVLGLSVAGHIAWSSDTQGPVYRGTRSEYGSGT